MGEVASIIKAFSCSDCAKYVCNSMHCRSKCRDCCEIDFVTEEIEIPDDDSKSTGVVLLGMDKRTMSNSGGNSIWH